MSFQKNHLLFSVLACCVMACNNRHQEPETGKPDVLASSMDTSVRPGDDFFSYANGGWIKGNPIPANEAGWGIFQIIPLENLKRIRDINVELSKTAYPQGSAEQKIGDFWKAANDTESIEKKGIQPLKPYLDKIDAIHDVSTLQEVMAELDKIGVEAAIGFSVGQDSKNSSLEALQLWQTGLTLPEREFYFKTDSTSIQIREGYLKWVSKILSLLGEDSVRAHLSAKNLLVLETGFARFSRKLEDLRNPYSNYNKYAIKDLGKVTTVIQWDKYISGIGAKKADSVIIGQPEYYTQVGKLLHSTPLDTWKDYLRLKFTSTFAVALPDMFDSTNFVFRRLLTGAKERKPRWRRVINSEEGVMGELLGQIYVKKYFDDTTKARYNQLVENIRSALKTRITQLDWMSHETKQKAISKLSLVNKKLGFPDKWKDFSSLKISPDSYFDNLVNANIFWHEFNINKLGKAVDKSEWDMYPQTYNAYYNPSLNEIVLPAAAFIIPGYNDRELDDAVIYGYAAASTIGHELTHGFDDEGRQYDGQGNLKGWWAPSDSIQFMKRAEVLVRQFNQYVAVDTFKINGKATLGENIADLGGVLLGLDAFKLTDQYKEGKTIAGLTPTQRFFLGYAMSWKENVRPEFVRTGVLSDEHSPERFRVIGPLSDVDAFYEAFQIKPGDKMYIPDSLRARIW
jgi:putative endopeptidase